MTCKGICHRYKISKSPNMDLYESGQKRWVNCGIFIQTNQKFCPCCGTNLRTKPRKRSLNEKLRIKLKKKSVK